MKRPIFAVIGLLLLASTARAGLPEVKPEAVGLDGRRLDRIDGVIDRAIGRKMFRGAVVLVARQGKIAYVKSFGHRALVPSEEPMTRDTIFDMASITKPVATASSVMVLLEQGKLRVDDTYVRHLPAFDSNGKRAITIEHLLRHRAGLIPDNPIGDFANGPATAWKNLEAIKLLSAPGDKFAYSDVGFMFLGRLVDTLGGKPLDEFASENLFKPLGLKDTSFKPDASKLPRIAPTERENGKMIRGVVHDPRARALGGVAGHAGLFSTADDLAVFAQMLLDGGKGINGERVLSPLTIRKMIDAADTPPNQRRGLGWDVATPYSGLRGALFGEPSFGHTGFTGTSLWVDPETKTIVIMLTSRLHPDGGGNPLPARAEIATIVASAITDANIAAKPPLAKPAAAVNTLPSVHPVLCGIDVLARDEFRVLKNKRVGLITNHTGRARSGESTIDILHKAPGVKLVRLFSPEHGIRGLVDKEIGDDVDQKTGLKVISLYSKSRKPAAELLKDLDVLVYDIQDIGTRFYTYIGTLGLMLEAAAENGKEVVVLDRPNPVGGVAVAGPIRDPDFAAFIAYHALPVRHGMTVGELAKMFNAERSIHAKLTVVPIEGWNRADLFDRTGLLWTNPSPNMRSLTEAIIYPGVGLLEATNLATGRGTDTPFERFGAPYIDPVQFATALNEHKLPGVRFVPIRFKPTERQFAGVDCGGANLIITDWSTFEPVDVGVAIAVTLRRHYKNHWKPDSLLKFIADRDAFDRLLAGESLAAIKWTWQVELDEFRRVRDRYLIYR